MKPWRERLRDIALGLGAMAALGACGGAPPRTTAGTPPPPAQLPPGIIQVKGDERIGWDQEIASGARIGDYTFVMYIDGRRAPLPDASCGATPSVQGYPCTASLPFLTDGRHTLNITAVRSTSSGPVESPRSVRLIVYKGVLPQMRRRTADAAGPATTSRPASSRARAGGEGQARGTAVNVETVVSGTGAVADLAALPDGRILVAESAGRIDVLADGKLDPQPMRAATDAAPGTGVVSVAVHPAFESNHFIYILYADVGGERTYTLARGREVNGRLGEFAVLLQADGAGPGPAAGAMRFGGDGKLYLALPSSSERQDEIAGSLLGKVLRLNDDGTVPADNPRHSTVFAGGNGIAAGVAMEPDAGRIYQTERAGSGRVVLLAPPLSPDVSRAILADLGPGARPAGIIVYSGAAFTAWRGQLLVARLDGGIDRLSPTSGNALQHIEPGDGYGSIRALVQAGDGSVYFGTSNGSSVAGVDSRTDRVGRLTPGVI